MTQHAKIIVVIGLMLGMALAALDTPNAPQGHSFPPLAEPTRRPQAPAVFQ